MLKLLIRNFSILFRTIKSVALRPLIFLRYRITTLTNLSRYINQIPKLFFSLLSNFKLRPEKREDYVDAGRVYIAKSLLAILVVLIIALPLLIHYFVWPWTVSTFLTASFYEGDTKLENYNGRVKIYYDEKMENLKFHGRLKDGKYTGKGKEFYENGMPRYEGEYVDGKYEGEGILYTEDGKLLYKGSFKAGKYEGTGMLLLPDDSIYEGDFVGGKRTGKGRILKGNILLYEGDMLDDKKSGNGQEYDQSGRLIYKGSFAEDVYDGEGTEYYPGGGVKYKGSFRLGLYSGKGLMYDEQGGLIYEGDFDRGLFNGTGRYYGNEGRLYYVGSFVDGLFDGEGKLIFDMNKKWYEGEFLAGKANGKGKLYKDGKLYYEGEFAEGRMSGNGTLTDAASGVTYTGPFENGDIAYGQLFKLPVADIYAAFERGFTEDTSGEEYFFLYNSAYGAVLKFTYADESHEAALVYACALPTGEGIVNIKSQEDLVLQGKYKFGESGTGRPSADVWRFLPLEYKSLKYYNVLFEGYQVCYWTDAETGNVVLTEYTPTAESPATAGGKADTGSNTATALGKAGDKAQQERYAHYFAELGLEPANFVSLGLDKIVADVPEDASKPAGSTKVADSAMILPLEQAFNAVRKNNPQVTAAAELNTLALNLVSVLIDVDLSAKKVEHLQACQEQLDEKIKKATVDFKTGKIDASVLNELQKESARNSFDLNYYKMQYDNAKKNVQKLTGTFLPEDFNYDAVYLLMDAGNLKLPPAASEAANAAELEKKLSEASVVYGELGDALSAYMEAAEKEFASREGFKTGKADAAAVEQAAKAAGKARMNALEKKAVYSKVLYELDCSLQGYVSKNLAGKESIFMELPAKDGSTAAMAGGL